ncbi:MAG: hypothetical protein ACO1RX_08415 [Candidatus Sericytochromatia bacterium]
MEQRTGQPAGKSPTPTPAAGFKDIQDVQRFLHQEQGFGRIVHGS